jgi:hypothetical protein
LQPIGEGTPVGRLTFMAPSFPSGHGFLCDFLLE